MRVHAAALGWHKTHILLSIDELSVSLGREGERARGPGVRPTNDQNLPAAASRIISAARVHREGGGWWKREIIIGNSMLDLADISTYAPTLPLLR